MEENIVTLSDGSGGEEMNKLIKSFKIQNRGNWQNYEDDSSTLSIANVINLTKLNDSNILENTELDSSIVMTTDSFVVDPIFFPGGNIGHLAFCGTINDLCVMGAKPLGISLSLIIEEGLPKNQLEKIISSINKLSTEYQVPIVTGDTKVMEKGKIDKIIINTTGIGKVQNQKLLTKNPEIGDKIIISGGLGEHAVALLSKRFEYETKIVSDSKPIIKEIEAIKEKIKIAKDPTRGGIATILNEISQKYEVGIELTEENIPTKNEVNKVVEMLGINLYQLASEGIFICVCPPENSDFVVQELKKYNTMACEIGKITNSNNVVIKTILGKRILPTPTGRIVPRIC